MWFLEHTLELPGEIKDFAVQKIKITDYSIIMMNIIPIIITITTFV